MSATLSAIGLCERAMRAVGAFPVTESAPDGEQLRETITWLDLIMAEVAGVGKVFSLIPDTISFNLTNGTTRYDLNGALGAQLPVDQVQFPVQAFLLIPQGPSTIAFSGTIPGNFAAGQAISDLTGPSNIPPGAVIASINAGAKQIAISSPSTVAIGDTLQVGTNPVSTIVAAGTINGVNQVAGTSMYRRREVPLMHRDEFKRLHVPNETGHPRVAFIDRLPAPALEIFPTPLVTDSALYIFQLDVQTYAPNVAPAGVTGTQPQSSVQHKFRQAWQRYLIFRLAHDIGCGAITKLPETSLNRFAASARDAKAELEAYENREHETVAPIGEAFDDHEYEHGGGYRRHLESGWHC